MESKAFRSLQEAAIQVQLGDTTQEPETNEVEIPECVQQYFENYFGDYLNEDTSDEDIMNAVYDLIDLTEVVYNEAHTLLPDHPDVVKYWGGREKFDKLNARLGNKKKIDRKPPKVEVTRKPLKKKKKRRQLELFAANQYFEAYFGQELNEDISQDDIMNAVYDLIDLTEAVLDVVQLDELIAATPRRLRAVAKKRSSQSNKAALKMHAVAKATPQQIRQQGQRTGNKGLASASNKEIHDASIRTIEKYGDSAKSAKIKSIKAERGARARESTPASIPAKVGRTALRGASWLAQKPWAIS